MPDDVSFSYNPSRYPNASTAYVGYLWKVELEPGRYEICDLDQLAAHEEDHGREVTILCFEVEATI